MGPNYLEVGYEDFVTTPRQALQRGGKFIDNDFEYNRILSVGIGSVSQPNTSSEGGGGKADSNPVGRWRKLLAAGELRALESAVGDELSDRG